MTSPFWEAPLCALPIGLKRAYSGTASAPVWPDAALVRTRVLRTGAIIERSTAVKMPLLFVKGFRCPPVRAHLGPGQATLRKDEKDEKDEKDGTDDETRRDDKTIREVCLTVPNRPGYPEVFGNHMVFQVWAQPTPLSVGGGAAWSRSRVGRDHEGPS